MTNKERGIGVQAGARNDTERIHSPDDRAHRSSFKYWKTDQLQSVTKKNPVFINGEESGLNYIYTCISRQHLVHRLLYLDIYVLTLA